MSRRQMELELEPTFMARLEEVCEGCILFDGLEEAAIGFTDAWCGGDRPRRVVYSGDRILALLMDRDGLDYDDAMEHIAFNIEEAYVGPHTPVIVWEPT